MSSTNYYYPHKPTKYALKQVQKNLLKKNSKEFTLAAADLCIEAMYLSSLSHPHILPARGMTYGGTSAFENKVTNEYFDMSLCQQCANIICLLPDFNSNINYK